MDYEDYILCKLPVERHTVVYLIGVYDDGVAFMKYQRAPVYGICHRTFSYGYDLQILVVVRDSLPSAVGLDPAVVNV